MKSLYLGIGIYMLFLCSCSRQVENKGDVEIINMISPDNIKLTELFEECQIIPLETTDSSLIGAAIIRVEAYQDRLYVLNQLQSHKNILCFDSLGHFLFGIDRIGRAPTEYTFLGDFFIETNKKQLVLVSEAGRYVFLDIDGHYLYDKKTQDTYMPTQIVFNDSNYVVYNDTQNHSKDCDLLILDTATMNMRRKLETNGDPTYNTDGRALSMYRGHMLYSHFNDTIYEVQMSGKRTPFYYLNGGNLQIESKKLIRKKRQLLGNDELFAYIYTLIREKKMKYISSILENEKWVVINAAEFTEEDTPRFFFVLYDKISKKSYSSLNIDFGFLNSKRHNLQVVLSANDALYCSVSGELSLEEIKIIKDVECLTAEDKNILIHRDESDNPFLIKLK